MRQLLAVVLTALCAFPAFALDDARLNHPLVLVADPGLDDMAFQRTVLLVAPLPDGGHIGVIANRPTRVQLANLFPNDPPSQKVRQPVFFGGPMGQVLVALLADNAPPGGKSVQMGDHVYLALEEKVIDRIIQERPDHARFMVGIVEWEPGELRQQIQSGAWEVADANADAVMQAPTDRVWDELATRAAGKPNAPRGSGAPLEQPSRPSSPPSLSVPPSAPAVPQGPQNQTPQDPSRATGNV